MALGGLVVCSTLATAQDSTNAPDKKGGKRGMSVDQMMDRYSEQLSLTDEQKPKVKTVINGPIPYAPDGNPLIGPVPGLPGFFHCCAFTFGIAQAGGAGKCIAEWVAHGQEPPNA